MSDSFSLSRFIEAQEPVYATVQKELAAGRKQSHWMWYIFPQLKGLGHSATAQFYAIGSMAEARAYLQHPTLGLRLAECTSLVCSHNDKTISQIFGYPDNLKFHSSMTLFYLAGSSNSAISQAIEQFCQGMLDIKTERLSKNSVGI